MQLTHYIAAPAAPAVPTVTPAVEVPKAADAPKGDAPKTEPAKDAPKPTEPPKADTPKATSENTSRSAASVA